MTVTILIYGANITDRNSFNKKLKDTTAIEREKLVLDIELQDQTATAEWFFNGEPIEQSDRYVSYNFIIRIYQVHFRLDRNQSCSKTLRLFLLVLFWRNNPNALFNCIKSI